MNDENQRLEYVAQNLWEGRVIDDFTIKHSFNIFQRFFVKGSILELGPAKGTMTKLLAEKFDDISVIEGSEYFCEILKDQFPDIKIYNVLFEDFVPEKKYDNIILGHVLEHVENPIELLRSVKNWLSDNGKIFCAVPNSRSLHRQAGVLMNLLDFEEQLNDTDRNHGHRRVYNPETFRRDFNSSGYFIEQFGGYWIKTQSNKQTQQNWTAEMIEAYMRLGERYPDIAAEIYVIASKA